jgi:two-component system chemotaxis response regulator CheY
MKCLVVDDDSATRKLLQYLLRRVADCDLAYDGHEAIAIFRVALEKGEAYDLVCLDIDMPLGNGHDALLAMRSLEEQHGIVGSDVSKVIMLTGLTDSKSCVQAFREGCEKYLRKPIDHKDFLATVDSLLVAKAAN